MDVDDEEVTGGSGMDDAWAGHHVLKKNPIGFVAC